MVLTKSWINNQKKWISLCDYTISRIEIKKNSVIFLWNKGFILVDGEKIQRISKGKIEMTECSEENLVIYYLQQKPSKVYEILSDTEATTMMQRPVCIM